MDIKENNRIILLFEKSRNWDGLEAFNLYKQLTLKDWNNIRNDEWYYISKAQRIKKIHQYLRNK